jgi:hypothetical protein
VQFAGGLVTTIKKLTNKGNVRPIPEHGECGNARIAGIVKLPTKTGLVVTNDKPKSQDKPNTE